MPAVAKPEPVPDPGPDAQPDTDPIAVAFSASVHAYAELRGDALSYDPACPVCNPPADVALAHRNAHADAVRDAAANAPTDRPDEWDPRKLGY